MSYERRRKKGKGIEKWKLKKENNAEKKRGRKKKKKNNKKLNIGRTGEKRKKMKKKANKEYEKESY